MRRHARSTLAGLLTATLVSATVPASAATEPAQADDGGTSASVLDEPTEGEVVPEPPFAPHAPRLAPCNMWEDRCTVAPGTVRIAWTLDVDDGHPVDTVDVTLRRRETGGVDRVYGRHRAAPGQTSVEFTGLNVGDLVTGSVLVRGPGGVSSASGMRFSVHDVTPTAPVVGIDDHTHPGRINVWAHPAIDVEFYGGELTYELQRRSGGVWTTTATGTWAARAKLTLPDTGCPLTTICSYRIRSHHLWGTSGWSGVASQRSLPVPTAPKLSARPTTAGRIAVTATPTTVGHGTWYAPHRFHIQRDTGAGWTGWSSGDWISGQSITRTDGTCPISRVCRYRVRTRTAVGNSAWTTINQRSMGPVTTTVRNLSVTSPRSRTVALRWDAPSTVAGRPVQAYEIWSGGNRLWRGTSRSVTLTGQSPIRTTYSVRAVNQWGNGPFVSRTLTVRR